MPARPTSRSDGRDCKVIFSRTLMSEKMRKVTETNATVLIQGESGTGKGIVSGHSFTTSTTS
ncbi:MAG: sigma-54 factor interaction domain-containing protein [Planctomycetes bacterium]|nr:sigma-54 factor interaction domain-containing protein [Planctomycetota bacterium]